MSASISNVKGHNMPTSHETDKLERFHIKTSLDSIFKDGMFNRHLLPKKIMDYFCPITLKIF